MVLHNDISMASVSFVSMEGVVAEEASTRAAGDAGIIVGTFINSLFVCHSRYTFSLVLLECAVLDAWIVDADVQLGETHNACSSL